MAEFSFLNLEEFGVTCCRCAQGVTESTGKMVRGDAKEKQHRTVIMMKVEKRLNHGDERGYQKSLVKTNQPQLPSGEITVVWRRLGSSRVSHSLR